MPTAFGDSVLPSSSIRANLEQNDLILGTSDDSSGIQLQSLPTRSGRTDNRDSVAEEEDLYILQKPNRPPPVNPSSKRELEENIAFDSLSESSSDNSQMGRKSDKPRREESGRPSSKATGGQNGHARGSMDSHLELRRKNPSLDSSSDSASQTAHLMNRDDFSLDEKPPMTPSTPTADTSFFDLPRQDRRNFLLLVLLYFLQGWALTLISQPNLSYASTAQTVGLTAGHFLSYTVFLAFNSPDFANRWFRSTPSEVGVMTLNGYLTFSGWLYLIVTLGLALFKREERTKEKDGIMKVYRSMVGILKLKNIQSIIIVHLIAKIGFQANDGVTNLKLLDKGFSQEDLALTVLLDFPFEVCLGYYAGRWSTAYPPIHIWCWAFIARLVAAVLAQGVVMIFPKEGVQTWYLLTVIASHMLSTFTNTVMFVAISAFHAKISDPTIGGTYMTLLSTVSNLGGTFPRFFILKLVDYFTLATCHPPSSSSPSKDLSDLKGELITSPFSCALEAQKHVCLDGGGNCVVERDGYYITNVICVVVGV
ncbi:MAG: hypothetical protein Q9222_002557, partial [Ikaeria aurantiellina]